MNKQGIAIYGVVSLPILIYWAAVIYFAVNIPFMDDFDNLLFFANAKDKWQLLFAQHNEHRLFFNRAVVWLMLTLNEQINFSILIYLANCILMVIVFLLVKKFPTENNATFLPLLLLVFNLQNWENMTWAMAGLQNYSVILFALFSFYFFSYKSLLGLLLSLVFASLATYSSGNGFLTFCVLSCWLAVDYLFKKIDKKIFLMKFSLLLIIFVLVILSYFYVYTVPVAHPLATFNVKFIHYFLVLLGGYTYVSSLATIIGIITVITILFLVYRNYFLQNPFYFYFILFLLGSLLMVTVARSELGIEHAAMSSRYKIVSLLLAACLYLALVEILEPVWRKKWITLCTILAVLLNLSSAFVNLPFLEQKNNLLVNGLRTWQTNHKEGLVHPNREHSSMVLQTAIKKGIYTPPVID